MLHDLLRILIIIQLVMVCLMALQRLIRDCMFFERRQQRRLHRQREEVAALRRTVIAARAARQVVR
jgi:hypothetical protein